ncbi:MAG: tetratricopeptide repeat protein, partial [Muribaculaceae bacterium]|nr:tetratricopeptide repeat protein [Muribaculaceae bacterium]
YEKKHQDRGFYPEALYYAGRVYADLGDYPESTKYYEKSLEIIPSNKKNDPLRFRVLYHLAWNLTTQCLYASADSISLKAILVAENMNDRYRQAISYELMGNSQLNRRQYPQALSSLSKAKRIFKEISSPDTLTTIIQIAFIQGKQGNLKEALYNIKRIEPQVDSVWLPLFLPMAAEIFLRNGDYQEAREAACRLLKLHDFSNRQIAYQILLNPDMELFLDPDSCVSLSREYASELASHYARRDSIQTINQQSVYNYAVHERNRIEAEKRLMKWEWAGITTFIALLILIIILLIRERNNNRKTILLQKTILDLTERLSQSEENNCREEDIDLSDKNDTAQEKKDDRKKESEKLLSRLIPLISGDAPDIQIEIPLASSDIVRKFRDNIVKNKLSHEDWQYLEQEVRKYSPDFRNNLSLLSNGTIEESEYRVALLIRCHFRPSEIGYLLNIKPGTVSSHRGNISKKIFGRNIGTRLIDRVIKSL